jgi:hypothetical protein
LSIGIIQKQSPEHGGKLIFGTLRRRDTIKLEDAHSSHCANVTNAVLETRAQRTNEILKEVLDAQGAQTTQGEAADHGVIVMAILLEEIDGKKSKIGMATSVIANVEVAHFFEDEIRSGGTHNDHGKKRGHVDADGHVGDDLGEELALEGIDSRLPTARQLAELRLEVGELALASRRIGIHSEVGGT